MAEGFLLLNEVAGLARVSVDTVRFWIRAGKLASVRPGRRRMVRRDVLEAFLRQDSHSPKASQRRAAAAKPTELDRRRAKETRRRLGLQT